MKRAILVPTIRGELFLKFLDSTQYLPEDWSIYVNFVDLTKQEKINIARHKYSDRILGTISTPTRTPPYIVRMALLKQFNDQVDVWLNMDDDIEFIPQTNYDPMTEKLQEKGTGLISGNWARTESLLPKKKLSDKFLRQPLVYTGGGMVFTHQAGEIFLSQPVLPYFADDPQFSIELYIRGYDNYRYLGSLVIHRIQIKGGLLKTYQTMNLVHPDPKLVTLRPCHQFYPNTNNNYFYPMSSDLTEYAHQLHKESKLS